MNNYNFSTEKDLYNKVKPALRTKQNEFSLYKIKVSTNDIWKHLINNKWNKSHNLKLCDIVDDILSLDIEDYVVNKKNINQKKEKDLL